MALYNDVFFGPFTSSGGGFEIQSVTLFIVFYLQRIRFDPPSPGPKTTRNPNGKAINLGKVKPKADTRNTRAFMPNGFCFHAV